MLLDWKGLQKGCFLLLLFIGTLCHQSLAPWMSGSFAQLGLGKGSLYSNVRIAPWHGHNTPGGLSYPLLGAWILMLWVVLRGIKHRRALVRVLNCLLSATGFLSARTLGVRGRTLGVRGETVFDCTNPKNSVADVDLSVVSDCPDFQSTYQNPTLQEVQIIQRTASTLVETYTCNLIVSREACHCK